MGQEEEKDFKNIKEYFERKWHNVIIEDISEDFNHQYTAYLVNVESEKTDKPNLCDFAECKVYDFYEFYKADSRTDEEIKELEDGNYLWCHTNWFEINGKKYIESYC